MLDGSFDFVRATKEDFLTKDEEYELFRRYREENCRESYEKLFKSQYIAVCKMAVKYSRISRHLTDKDLIQEGTLGLLRAIDKFNTSSEMRLSTYAYHWIKQTITRTMANKERLIRLPVHIRDRLYNITGSTVELEEELGRAPVDEEIAKRAGLTKDEYDKAVAGGQLRVASLDILVGEESSSTLGDIIPDTVTPRADAESDAGVRHDAIANALAVLTDKQRFVLRYRFGLNETREGMTLEDIGALMNLTRERVRQIEMKALKRLRKLPYAMRELAIVKDCLA